MEHPQPTDDTADFAAAVGAALSDLSDVDAIRAQLRAGTAHTRYEVVHEAWYFPYLPPNDRAVRVLDIGVDQVTADGRKDGSLGEWQLTFHADTVQLNIYQGSWPAFVACGFSRVLADLPETKGRPSQPADVARWLQIAGYRDVTDREGPHA